MIDFGNDFLLFLLTPKEELLLSRERSESEMGDLI